MKKRRQWQANFIHALRIMGNVWRAAKYAKIDRTCVYDAYDRDAEFRKAWDAAEEESADRLEAEAWRRAHDGIDKPIYYEGRRVDCIKEYSDTLLTLLLRARRPAKFRENYNVAIGNPDGSNLQIDSRQQAINLFTTNQEAAQHMIALANLMIPAGNSGSDGHSTSDGPSQILSGDAMAKKGRPLTEKIWIAHPESDSVFQGTVADLATDGNLIELTEEEARHKIALKDCVPGNLAHTPPASIGKPVEKKSKKKAAKPPRSKKDAPKPQEIDLDEDILDDSDAVPL